MFESKDRAVTLHPPPAPNPYLSPEWFPTLVEQNADAPPLTDAQVARIAPLLTGASK